MGAQFFLSPLRYPGGKGRLTRFLGALMADQPTYHHTYVEPFAGGAGAALQLLYGEWVERIVLNDLDHHVAAMWRAIFRSNERFQHLIRTTPVTVEEWHRQRELFSTEGDDLTVGFATFFLNRTNRSGILAANPIGGLDQSGTWKIDARYDVRTLMRRVDILGCYRNRVVLMERDGVEVAAEFLDEKGCFTYADPPYIDKGAGLYLDAMTWPDHQRLSAVLRRRPKAPWMLTYDCDPRVPSELYRGFRCIDFAIAHTAQTQHVGREYAVFSNGVRLRGLDGLGAHDDHVLLEAQG